MIQEVVVVMTLLGCGDQAQNCDYIQEKQQTWITKEACLEAVPAAVKEFEGAPYPVITAKCRELTIPQEVAQSESGLAPGSQPSIAAGVTQSPSGYLQTTTMFDEIRSRSKEAKPGWLAKTRAYLKDAFAETKALLTQGGKQDE